MRKILLIGALGAAVSLAVAAGVAQAQAADSGAAPAAAAAAAASGPVTLDTPIGDLIANPAGHAVIAKDLPDLLTYSGLDQIKSMSLNQVAPMSQGKIDQATLTKIGADLAAAQAAPAAAPK